MVVVRCNTFSFFLFFFSAVCSEGICSQGVGDITGHPWLARIDLQSAVLLMDAPSHSIKFLILGVQGVMVKFHFILVG